MPQPLKAAMPLDLNIADGYVVRFTAIDPTSGATVTGVKVSGATIQAAVITGTPEAAPVKLEAYMPAFIYGDEV